MSRQLTPEEQQIIRRTEEEGARMAAEEEKEHPGSQKHGTVKRFASGIVFVLVFVLFVFLAYFVVNATMNR